MSTATFVSVSDYLSTTYQPDREYLDGVVVERNLGERDHSWLQGEILFHLRQYRSELNLYAFVEQRIQVTATRFRVPDISVLRGFPNEQVFTKPPFLCTEVLTPQDSLASMQPRLDDYVAFGVENIWLIDPARRQAFLAGASGIHKSSDAILTTGPVRLDVTSLWR